MIDPDAQRNIQAMKDKQTREFKPSVSDATKKFVATASVWHRMMRDRKRARMVSQGQMRGGFPAD